MLLSTNVYDIVFYWIVHLNNILYLKHFWTCGYVFSILVDDIAYVSNLLGWLIPSWIWFIYIYIYIYIYIFVYIYYKYIYYIYTNIYILYIFYQLLVIVFFFVTKVCCNCFKKFFFSGIYIICMALICTNNFH